MTIQSTIQNSTAFNRALSGARRRNSNLVETYGELVAYVFIQITEHGNATEAAKLREALPQFALKPKGMTVRAFDQFVADYTAFDKVAERAEPKNGEERGELVTKFKKVTKGKNFAALPEDHCRFWDYPKGEAETPEFNLEAWAKRASKTLDKQGINVKDAVAALRAAA